LRDTDFLPAAFFVAFLPDVFRPAGFFAEAFFVTFRRDGFLAADFFAVFLAVGLAAFRAAVFRDDFFRGDFVRAADLRADAVFDLDFFLVTLRFVPVAFLPADVLRDAALFLPPPAALRLLLAAFFAGIIDSCRSEKNAELYIAGPNMEAYFQPFFRASGGCFPPPPGSRADAREHCEETFATPQCLTAATIVLSGDFHYTTAIRWANGVKPPDATQQDKARRL
jgi:hypothetical protein